MKIANQFMDRFKIDFGIQMKVRRYLEFEFNERNNRISDEEQTILGKLSSELKEEILFQAHGNAINSFPVLRLNFSISTLRKIAKIIKFSYISSKEKIIQVFLILIIRFIDKMLKSFISNRTLMIQRSF